MGGGLLSRCAGGCPWVVGSEGGRGLSWEHVQPGASRYPAQASVCSSIKWGEAVLPVMGWGGGAQVGGQTYFDELHVQLRVLFHVLQQISVERLHLCGVQGGGGQGGPNPSRPQHPSHRPV